MINGALPKDEAAWWRCLLPTNPTEWWWLFILMVAAAGPLGYLWWLIWFRWLK